MATLRLLSAATTVDMQLDVLCRTKAVDTPARLIVGFRLPQLLGVSARTKRWRTFALGGILVLITVLSLRVCAFRFPLTGFARRAAISHLRADLIAAIGAKRLVEPRLIGFGNGSVSGSALANCDACAVIASSIQRQAQRHPSGVSLADLGVVMLAAGKIGPAVDLFEQAVARDPENPDLETDLAAAYIADAHTERRPHRLVQALEAATRAHDSSPEARFDRADALDALHLRSEAASAWRLCVAKDTDSDWRREAGRRLALLEAPPRADLWSTERLRLEKATLRGERSQIEDLVGRFRQEARSMAQDQALPGWGSAYERGDSAAANRSLSLARSLGTALVKVDGERSVADAVDAIDRAAGSAPLLHALARGHAAYGDGRSAYEQLRVAEARSRLASAERGFQAGHSTAGLWVSLWLAGTDYYLGQHTSAVARLDALLADSRLRSYPALRGRALWARGLIELQHMALARSLADFTAGLQIFAAIGESENAGAMNYLLAENFDLLGDLEEAWTYRQRALSILSGFPDSLRRNNLLLEAAKSLLKEDLPRAALHFHREELTIAQRRKNPVQLAEALLLGARLEVEFGDAARGADDLTQAQSAVAHIADPALRERLAVDAQVASSQVTVQRDPARTVAPLAHAIAYYQSHGLGQNAAFSYLLQARGWLALHDDGAAERDLQAGVEAFESARDSLGPEWVRARYLEQWQTLFDDMISLQAIRLRRPAAALDYAERAKHDLGCREGGGGTDGPPRNGSCGGARLSLDAIQSSLPDRTALVEYALLPDHLVTWLVRRKSLVLIRRDLPAEQVNSLVENLVRKVRDGGLPGESQAAAASLFEQLLRPVAAHLTPGERLIVVPDKALSAVPFAALYDRERARYLVEERAVSVAPSAAFYAMGRRAPQVPASSWHLLAVAPADLGRPLAPTNLPAAAAEAAEIAGLYPRHQLLAGGEATRARFLSALRSSDAVEFAGHAVANPKEPPLSRLLFSPDPVAVDAEVLYAKDLRQLALGHLRLVVLSACSTAPGSRARAEGIGGVAQAFLQAGVPAVVATLWKVDDAAARRVALEFHRRLLAGADGAEALRSAQLSLLHDHDESWRQPAGWAAFQLFGAVPPPDE
jgi:CHAT domain-containing protein